MAMFHDCTAAPDCQRGLLSAFADAAPAPTPALTAATVDMLDAIERTARARDIRGRFVELASVPKSGETPDLPPGPLLATGPDTLDAIRVDLDALVAGAKLRTVGNLSVMGPVPENDTPSLSLPAPLPSLTSAFSRRRAIFGAHHV